MREAWDLTLHLPIPAIVLGVSGTAQLIRIMRSNLLDELRKPYVMTARARGLPEHRVILRYPVRVALNRRSDVDALRFLAAVPRGIGDASAAFSQSASAKTMLGDFPPSSSETRVRLRLASSMMRRGI